MTALVVHGAPRLAPAAGRAIIAHHSKSFSLASLLLAPRVRRAAVGLYAYCRRADDVIDLAPPEEAAARLSELRRELDDVYAGRALSDPTLVEFQTLVVESAIPRAYPEALLEGFELDSTGHHYETLSDLLHYCWCVAGSVGAMMCHVLGVRRERAVVHGVHLGMAMQLTNICRDVADDWQHGRLYLPAELAPELRDVRALPRLPRAYSGVCARAVRRLLAEARVLYESGDLGLPYLSFRSRLGVATARHVYSAIGQRILASDADVLAGRAVVPPWVKLLQVARAGTSALAHSFTSSRLPHKTPQLTVRYPEDVVPF